nr:LemA family protein [Providencia rettgeri]
MEKLIFFIIIAVISYIFIRYLINIYNNIVFLKNNCHKAFANIDVLLKKQIELVPVLTHVADKAMAHEKQLFSELIASRQRYLSSSAIETKVDIANQLTAKIKPLLAVAENYPTLISKAVLRELQTQVKHIEDQLQTDVNFSTKPSHSTIQIFMFSPIWFLPDYFVLKISPYSTLNNSSCR